MDRFKMAPECIATTFLPRSSVRRKPNDRFTEKAKALCAAEITAVKPQSFMKGYYAYKNRREISKAVLMWQGDVPLTISKRIRGTV